MPFKSLLCGIHNEPRLGMHICFRRQPGFGSASRSDDFNTFDRASKHWATSLEMYVF